MFCLREEDETKKARALALAERQRADDATQRADAAERAAADYVAFESELVKSNSFRLLLKNVGEIYRKLQHA